MNKVYIMLSTYNGEKYLKELIDSIVNQENVIIKLFIRDDGSRDNTISIIENYILKNNHKNVDIELHKGENIGLVKSFMWLINNCPNENGAYYAFADQDDIWDTDKIDSAIKMLKKCDSSKPLMYYSDLKVVDKDGNFIRKANTWEGSFNKYKISVFIGVRGCTMVLNDKLHCLLKPYVVKDILGYDCYISLAAFWLGDVIYDKTAHINYRQTGNNVSITGTNKFDHFKKNIIYIRKRLTVFKNGREKNAKELLSHYYDKYPNLLEELKDISEYRNSISNRLKLLFNRKYKGFSLSINLFNMFLIIIGRL